MPPHLYLFVHTPVQYVHTYISYDSRRPEVTDVIIRGGRSPSKGLSLPLQDHGFLNCRFRFEYSGIAYSIWSINSTARGPKVHQPSMTSGQ